MPLLFSLHSCLRRLVIIIIFAIEVSIVPEVVSHQGLVDGFQVDDYGLFVIRFEPGIPDVVGRNLQTVKGEAGGLVVDLAGEQELDHLHERDLYGVGVFQNRYVQAWPDLPRKGFSDGDVVFMPAFMEKAEAVAAHGG